jgi:hypothetical protein
MGLWGWVLLALGDVRGDSSSQLAARTQTWTSNTSPIDLHALNCCCCAHTGNPTEQSRMYGRHFDHNDQLVSKISRESINALKAHFADEMTKDDWRLVRAAPELMSVAV